MRYVCVDCVTTEVISENRPRCPICDMKMAPVDCKGP